jgi:cytochrome P450/NADPH-cytochrome P450 reductase
MCLSVRATSMIEKLMNRASGREVGQAVLYYGCHSRESDALYDQELSRWEQEGVVSVRHTFSRSPLNSKGCKYVQ